MNKLSECVPEIIRLYASGISGEKIAEKFNVSPQAIYYRLKKASVTLRKSGPAKGELAGEHNGNWKGGKHIDTQGYVCIRINGKYIREHRIIAGKILGRKLRKGEVIHHKNGNKKDNSTENIEVFASHSVHMASQHSGIDRLRQIQKLSVISRKSKAILKLKEQTCD